MLTRDKIKQQPDII